MPLLQSFRWFGPRDPVSLGAIRQTGARGIVTALHDVPVGEVWQKEAIRAHLALIASENMVWSVVESLNVHEAIKLGLASRDELIEKYIVSLSNLAFCGVKTVCYNFMPLLDWTRTELDYKMPDGARALRFDAVRIAAFDIFHLKRENASLDYSSELVADAERWFQSLPVDAVSLLERNVLAGVPGTASVFKLEEFRDKLGLYQNLDASGLRSNLSYFLQAVVPHAKDLGIKMCIHPDDPPFPVLGLPRIVSDRDDLAYVLSACPSPSNGITFCTGSLGARATNDLPSMIREFGSHIHFFHLRNVRRETDYFRNGELHSVSFHEDRHLEGSSDMRAIMKEIVSVLAQRLSLSAGRSILDQDIPMRPDHGHFLSIDQGPELFPGYSLLGRMKGLAEMRGLELGLAEA